MTCALSAEQIKDLYKVVLKYLTNAKDGGMPISVLDISNQVYNAINTATSDPARAMAYVQLIPSIIAQSAFVSSSTDLFEYMTSNGVNIADVFQLSKDFAKSPDNITKFLGLDESNEDTLDALDENDKEDEIKNKKNDLSFTNADVRKLNSVNRRAQNPMRVFTIQEAKSERIQDLTEETVNLTDTSTEDLRRKAFQIKLNQRIAVLTGIPDNMTEDGGLLYKDDNGVTTVLYLTLMRNKNLPNDIDFPIFQNLDELKKNNPSLYNQYQNGSIAVITNDKNEPIFFDNDFNVVDSKEKGTASVLRFFNIEKIEQDLKSKLIPEGFRKNADVVKNIREYLSKNEDAKLLMSIGESSMGQFENVGRSKLSGLANLGESQEEILNNFSSNVSLLSQNDKADNRLVLQIKDGAPGTIFIESNYLHFGDTEQTKELARFIADLIFTENLKLGRSPISYEQKKKLIQSFYIHGSNDPFQILFDDKKQSVSVLDQEGNTVKTADELYNLLTENFPGQEYSKQVSIAKDFLNGKDAFKLYTIKGNKIETTDSSYAQFLYDNITWKFSYTDKGELRRMNGYLTFELTDSSASKLEVDKSDLATGISVEREVRTIDDTTIEIVKQLRTGRDKTKANPDLFVYSYKPKTEDRVPGITPEQHYDNPWTHLPSKQLSNPDLIIAAGETDAERQINAVLNYEKWLKGEGFQDVESTRREWILKQINSGALDGKMLIKTATINNKRSHPDVLVDLIKSRERQEEQASTEEKVKVKVVSKRTNKTSTTSEPTKKVEKVLNAYLIKDGYDYTIEDGDGNDLAGIVFNSRKQAIKHLEKYLLRYTLLEENSPGELNPASEEKKIEVKDNATLNPPGAVNPNDSGNPTEIDLSDDDLAFFNRSKTLDREFSKEANDEALRWWNSPANAALRAQAPLNLMFNIANSDAWAIWTNAARTLRDGTQVQKGVTLFEGSNYTDIYHEAWHVFSQLFLTKEDKIRLYKSIRKQPGTFKNSKGVIVKFENASFFDIEEYLAEDYRNYSINQQTKKGQPVRNTIFRRIFNFIKSLFTGPTKDELFAKLYFGKINKYTPNFSNVMFNALNSIKPVSEEFAEAFSETDTVILNSELESLYSATVVAILKNSPNQTVQRLLSTPASRKEILNIVKKQFSKKITDFEKQLENPDLSSAERVSIEDRLRILRFGFNNFGNIDEFANDRPAGGLLQHFRKSELYINIEVETEEENADNADPSNVDPDKAYGIQNKSAASNLSLDIKNILKIVRQVEYKDPSIVKIIDVDGRKRIQPDNVKYKTNQFGDSVQADYTKLVRSLIQVLGGREQSYDAVIKALEDNLTMFPIFQQVIDLLPNETQQLNDSAARDLATDFILQFTRPVVPNIVATVNKVEQKKEDNSTTQTNGDVRITRLASAASNVKRNWISNFTYSKSRYVVKDDKGVAFLDIEQLVKKFGNDINIDARSAFLEALGIELSPQVKYLIDGSITDDKKVLVDDGELKKIFEAVGYLYSGLKALNNTKINYKAEKKTFLQDPIKYITNGLTGLNALKEAESNVKRLAQSTLLNSLANLEILYSGNYNAGAALNANGDPVFDSTFYSTVSFIVNAVNNSKTLVELYAKYPSLNPKNNPLLEYNDFINRLYENGRRIKNITLSLSSLAGLSESINGSYTNEGKTETDLTVNDKFITEINTFLGSKGIIEVPRHSSKNTALALYLEGTSDKKLSASDIKEGFYNRLESELKRILLYKRESTSEDYISKPGYDKRVHAYYNSTGESVMRPSGDTLNYFNDILSDELKEKLYKTIDSSKDYSYDIVDEILDDIEPFNKDLSNYLNKVTEESFERYSEIKKMSPADAVLISPEILREFGNNARNAIQYYTAMSIIRRFDTINLIHGDIAQFDMMKENYSKYNSGTASSGNTLRRDNIMVRSIRNGKGGSRPFSKMAGVDYEYDGATLNTAVVEDFQSPSPFSDDIKQNVIAYYKEFFKLSDAKAKELYEKEFGDEYDSMTVNDGQAYITFDTYRIIRMSQNKWSNEHEAIFRAILNRESIDSDTITKYFPVIKFQHYGNLNQTGLPVTAYHKFSLMPLIPTAIQNTPYQKLNDEMIRQRIDYVTVKSGSKLNDYGKPTKIYKNLETGELLDTIDFTPNNIHIEFLKEVTNTSDSFKFDITFSTQMRKLIEDNLYRSGKAINDRAKAAIDSYEANIKLLTQTLKYEFLREIGWEETADGQYRAINGNNTKLARFLTKELARKGYPKHIIDRVRVDQKGGFLSELSFLTTASQIETMIASAVSRKITKQKVYGQQAVMVSSANYAGLIQFEKATLEDIQKWLPKNVVIPYYTKVTKGDANSLTRAMGVAVSLSGDFLNLLKLKHLDGKDIATRERLNEMIINEEWLNQDPDRVDALRLAGARIPVQGLNSMEFAQVYHFLPTEAGSIIIPPAEIVIKSGADFDFDKLPTLLPKIDSDGKVIKKSSYETISLLDDAIKNLVKEKRKDDDIKSLSKDIDNLKKQFTENSESISESLPVIIERLNNANNLRDEYKAEIRSILDQVVEDGEDLPNELIGYSSMDDKQLIAAVNSLAIEVTVVNGENRYKYLSPETGSPLSAFNYALAEVYDQYHIQRKPLDAAINAINEIKEKYPDFKRKFDAAVEEYKATVSESEKKIIALKQDRKNFKYGIMNALIKDMHNILSLPENYLSLIKPNSTGLVKGVADELKDKLSKTGNLNTPKYSKTNGKETSYISGTRALEPIYNIDKFNQFLVSKKGLGIAAIENTFNVLFNALGAETAAQYIITNSKNEEFSFKYRMLLDHNSVKNSDGETVIDLSQINSKGTNVKIGDIYSQLINGFVDAEKDPWIFYLQANLQTTPVLLYMIKAGVPFRDAAFFVSNPLIREYVRIIQSKKSLYLSDKQRENATYNARKEMLMKYSDLVSDENFRTVDILNAAEKVTGSFNTAELESIVDGKEQKRALDALLHYFELEEQSKKQTELKLSTNFDTTKDNTIFAAKKRKSAIDILSSDSSYAKGLVTSLVEDSVISSFYLSEFVASLGGAIQNFRQDSEIDDFIIALASERNFNNILSQTFSDVATYATEFKNDIVLAIYQNSINTFRPGYTSEYKSGSIDKTIPVQYKKYIPGTKAILKVIDDKLQFLYDGDGVKNMYALSRTNNGNAILQKEFGENVTSKLFPNLEVFENFVAERAFQRYLNPKLTKEEVSDRALTQLMNMQYVFMNKETAFANQLLTAIDALPEVLKSNFSVLGQIYSDVFIPRNNGAATYKLRFDDKGLDADLSQSYYEQLKRLSEFSELNQIVKTEAGSKEEKQLKDLAYMFKFLPHYIFYQSGISNYRNPWTKVLDTTEPEMVVKNRISSNNFTLDTFTDSLKNPLKESFTIMFNAQNNYSRRQASALKIYFNDPFKQGFIPFDSGTEIRSLQTPESQTDQFMIKDNVYIIASANDVLEETLSPSNISRTLSANKDIVYVLPISYKQYVRYMEEVNKGTPNASNFLPSKLGYNKIISGNYSFIITGYENINDGFVKMSDDERGKVTELTEQLLKALVDNTADGVNVGFTPSSYMDVAKAGIQNLSKYKDLLLSTNQVLYTNFGYLNNGVEQLEDFKKLVMNAEGITQQDIDDLENTCTQ